jgi:proteasome lid subunit RPN8/RPN11
VRDEDPASDWPDVVSLPETIAEAITSHALAEAPNEACGFVTGSDVPARGGLASRYVPCRNALASPSRYSVHPDDLLRLVTGMELSGEEIWAVVHSHVRSPAVPSSTDVAEAALPEALYLVVSLAAAPQMRAWRIDGGAATEVALGSSAAGSTTGTGA